MRHGLLLFAYLLTVGSIQRVEAAPCGLLDNSSTALSALARSWNEDWSLERLQQLWGRKPDRLVHDTSGAVDRVLWSEGSFEGVGCSVSVNIGDATDGRAIYINVTGVDTIHEAIQRASTIVRTLGVQEQTRILKDLRRATRTKTHWERDYHWDHLERRDAASGGTTTLEVSFARDQGQWRVVCRYLRIIPAPPGAD